MCPLPTHSIRLHTTGDLAVGSRPGHLPQAQLSLACTSPPPGPEPPGSAAGPWGTHSVGSSPRVLPPGRPLPGLRSRGSACASGSGAAPQPGCRVAGGPGRASPSRSHGSHSRGAGRPGVGGPPSHVAWPLGSSPGPHPSLQKSRAPWAPWPQPVGQGAVSGRDSGSGPRKRWHCQQCRRPVRTYRGDSGGLGGQQHGRPWVP